MVFDRLFVAGIIVRNYVAEVSSFVYVFILEFIYDCFFGFLEVSRAAV